MAATRRLDVALSLQLEVLINHEVRGVFGAEERLFMQKKRGESIHHVAMKVLSYFVFFDPRLEIEVSAGQQFKPDLVCMDERGEPTVWVECGTTSLEKLESLIRVNPNAEIGIVKEHEGAIGRYAREARRRFDVGEQVRFIAFGDGLVDRLAQCLHRRHELVVTVSGESEYLYLTVDEHQLSGAILEV